MAKSTNTNLRQEYFKYSIMIWIGVLASMVAIKVLSKFAPDNSNEAIKKAKEILISPMVVQAIPEPKEKIVFLGTIILTILTLFVTYFAFDYFFKTTTKLKDNIIHIISAINIGASCYFLYYCFTNDNPWHASPLNSHDYISKTNFDFFFIDTFLYKNLLFYSLILFPLIAYLTIKKLTRKIDSVLHKLIIVFCVSLALITFFISSFKFPYTYENKYNFCANFYSTVQVYNGSPLLVDGFVNTYGLYPHFIMPILKLAGLSILSYTMTMGVILFSCLCFLIYFMNKVIENKLILLLGFCLFFSMTYMFQAIALSYYSGFSCAPIRWLMPLTLFMYVVIYNAKKVNQGKLFKNLFNNNALNITPIKILSFYLFAFGVLWNPDFGLFSFIVLIAYYVYYEFNISDFKTSLIKTGLIFIQAVVLLVAAFLTYSCFIRFFYGASPDFSMLFKTISTFSFIGFGMLPMPTGMQPWILVAIVYGIGWVITVNSFLQNNKSKFSSAVFVVTFLGTLGLIYYQGRSHNWQLYSCYFPAFILLPIYTDKLFSIIKDQKIYIPVFLLSFYFIAFAPFQLLKSMPKLWDLVYDKKSKVIQQSEENQIKNTAFAIDKLCDDGEKIYILSADHYQGIHHGLSKTASIASPGRVELFFKKDYEKIIEKIKNENKKLFVEPQFYRPFDTKFLNVIAAYYELNPIEGLPSLYYYKRREFGKYQSKLIKDDSTVFYINANTDGEENLKLCEAKVTPLQLGNAFTIDILFTPPSNSITGINTGGAVLSNLDGNKGFVIQQQKDNPNQYIFGFKGKGVLCNVELNKQTKMTFKVDGVTISSYIDNRLQSNILVTEAFENSQLPLCMGSMQNTSNFYLGNIAEIKISKGVK
ncbi:MAG: hypothetical protein J0M08_06245 [Bacteroidetes bacterium]|nr:hypothetical protein [Bacteroidota bacterium]